MDPPTHISLVSDVPDLVHQSSVLTRVGSMYLVGSHKESQRSESTHEPGDFCARHTRELGARQEGEGEGRVLPLPAELLNC